MVDESELQRFQQVARACGLTTSEWARQVLRRAERDVAVGDPERKLSAIRSAIRHAYPSGDIDDLLAETERGRSIDLQA